MDGPSDTQSKLSQKQVFICGIRYGLVVGQEMGVWGSHGLGTWD